MWAGSPIQDVDADDGNLNLLDASAEKPQTEEVRMEPVLDQLEVERVLLSLESEDEGIRAMVSVPTYTILLSIKLTW